MPGLAQSLQGRDLGHLRIVAELWGFELTAPDTRSALQQLEETLLKPDLAAEVIESLSVDARSALDDLAYNAGRLPWTVFTRRFGSVREMGAARRDRERPYRTPTSPAEVLWYRALLARSFFETPGGAVEFAYIPDDLLPLVPAPAGSAPAPLGRAASLVERSFPVQAGDSILDRSCTLLAALRLGLSGESVSQYAAANWSKGGPRPYPLDPAALRALLEAAALLDEQGLPRPEPVRLFLEAPRGEALAQLVSAWISTVVLNELRQIPHLQAEGSWQNDPLASRQTILGFLAAVPRGQWWSMPAFVNAIRQEHPDYQRQSGDYDSWYVRDLRVEPGSDPHRAEFLRGFEHWDDVDGELVRFVIAGPMHWLGLVDLAFPSAEAAAPTAFRFSRWSASLLKGEAPEGLHKESEAFLVRSNARVHAPALSPRSARYQLARFCAWEGEREKTHHYRVTPASLARARQQGLSAQHLQALLRRYAQATPPSLIKALDRWEQHGAEARLERVTVLRLSSPELLQTLRSSKASRFLGDPLGPTVVIVKPGAADKVLAFLAELGYLGEAGLEE